MNSELSSEFRNVRIGIVMALLCLVFGIGLGVSFGINGAMYQQHVATGIAAHPELHDAISQVSISRWATRAHFHATGISAFELGLIVLVMFSGMTALMKKRSAILIGLGGLYPLSWLTMYWIAPEIGRKAAHEYWLVKLFVYVGVGGLALGILLLALSLFWSRPTVAA
jgi:hypothetical protein